MARFVIVKAGAVTNVIVAATSSDYAVRAGESVHANDSAGIGWSYDGTTFTPPPAPSPTPESLRSIAFTSDPDRADIVNALRTNSLTELETYIRSRINADAVTDLASARLCMKRIETAIVRLAKVLAITVRV